MKLQVLVSTMHQNNYIIIEEMNIKSDAVIINQCDIESIQMFKFNDATIKWIDSKDRGLSVSRNMALKNSDSDICLLADDDLVYLPDYEATIVSQFEKYPDADIIAFQVQGIERKFKNYHPRYRSINFLTSMKISSVEIAFRLDSIKKNNILFNNLFGSGSKYFMGEEGIFLSECLKHGLKIIYVPIKIANLHLNDSTWFKGFNKEYLISRGAVFTAMTKSFSLFFIIQFAIRKARLFPKDMSIIQAVGHMLEGKKKFLSETEKN